jgi:hypothetical protein
MSAAIFCSSVYTLLPYFYPQDLLVLPAGPAPTSVVERKSDSGWLHLVSAKRPRTLNRSFPLPNLYPQSLLLRLPAGAILER